MFIVSTLSIVMQDLISKICEKTKVFSVRQERRNLRNVGIELHGKGHHLLMFIICIFALINVHPF